MAKTIEQIQELINAKAVDPRQLINEIADYLQANPPSEGGGSGSQTLQEVLSEGATLDDDFTIEVANGKALSLKNGAEDASQIATEQYVDDNAGGLLQVASVILNDAQIKALPSTPVQIIASPGAGKVIVPVAGFCIANYTAPNAYGSLTSAALQLLGNVGVSAPLVADTLLGTSNTPFAFFSFPQTDAGAGFVANLNVTNTLFDLADIDGYGLFLQDTFSQFAEPTPITEYTGGNAANTLRVIVYYIVIEL